MPFYQLPLILTALLPDIHCQSHGICLHQVMMTLHYFLMTLLMPLNQYKIEIATCIAELGIMKYKNVLCTKITSSAADHD